MRITNLLSSILLSAAALAAPVRAEIPAPAAGMAEWSVPWNPAIPGVFAADAMLPKPAGQLGPVVVKNGHFYTGDQRIRFWGVNICFSGCFPTHQQADAVAARLARFGVNAVRFHHMDMSPFPRGLFTDNTLEEISPEALDRLDYFIAALKKQGIYANLNLHVSRSWSKAHKWPNADQLEGFDKMVDIFHPELIAVQKQFARDLLHHVNPYTKTRYADEPAVAMVEITNEDTLFLWGGETKLQELPEPYDAMFTQLWNQWLVKKYGSRAKLAEAWNAGAQSVGPNVIRDPKLVTLNQRNSAWSIEQHDQAKMTAALDHSDPATPLAKLTITQVSGTSWHLQFNQAGHALKKGQTYTLSFRAKADKAGKIDAVVAQAHQPYNNLGLSYAADIGTNPADYQVTFTANTDDANARVSFSLGREVNTIYLGNVKLQTGGLTGLDPSEDPAKNSVARPRKGRAYVAARSRDWYDFVQSTDEAYFVGMYRFLKDELGVKAPITGTIGLGVLGTLSQSKMDFVDAHAYWDHPTFPRRQWDSKDWVIGNKPMVDNPEGATLWRLGAVRVDNKPFTVTEYNHSHPNEWQAEGIPMIAAYAALQDWDGVFLFSYSHSDRFERSTANSFFDIEGNPLKMAAMPIGARLFLSDSMQPLFALRRIYPNHETMLDTGSRHYYDSWSYLRQQHNLTWEQAFTARLAVSYLGKWAAAPAQPPQLKPDPRVSWTATGPGTGRFIINDPHAAIFAGFVAGKLPIDIAPLRIEQLETPFATLVLTPADPRQTIDKADRLLLLAMARAGNTNTRWDERRRSVSDQWGTAPVRIEVVKGTLSLATSQSLKCFALGPSGERVQQVPLTRTADGRLQLQIGGTPTLWYELTTRD